MPKALNLTNQRFGKLIALEKAPKRNDKYTRWICKCDCGNITEVRTDYLTSGHTKSCGCVKEKLFKEKDITNQRFGKLIAIKKNPKNNKWICQCDCGNITEVEISNLTSGNTKSCGCYQKEQASLYSFKTLVGQRFGKLTVIKRVENNKFGHVCYLCQCDCGGQSIVDATNLRNGITNSCGCIKSKGEMIINNWLQEHQINFISQYAVEEIVLESGRHPFFDFAIFKNNKLYCLIEYDGKQHYEYSGYGWDNEENFKQTQYRDKQKNEWCEKLNIPLYRIKYNDNIIEVLEGIAKVEAEAPDIEEAEEIINEEVSI